MTDFDERVERRRAETRAARERLAAHRAAQEAEQVRLAAEAAARQAALYEAEQRRLAPINRVAGQIQAFLHQLNESPSFKAVFYGFVAELDPSTKPSVLFRSSSEGKIGALFRDQLGEQDDEAEEQEALPPELDILLRVQQRPESGDVAPLFRVSYSVHPVGVPKPRDGFTATVDNDQGLDAVLDKMAETLARTVADLQDQLDQAAPEVSHSVSPPGP